MRNKINLIVSSLKEELTCALCQDVFEKPQALLPCLHTFCLECLGAIPREYDSFSCPICRATVSRSVANYSLQNIIEIFKQAELDSHEEQLDRSTSSTPTRTIESLNIDGGSGESSSSSLSPNYTISILKKPCRSCLPRNGTNFTCNIPITDTQQTGFGHIFCGYCSEYLPARGVGGNEPSLQQCCSFCGIVACDQYWGCKNKAMSAKLHILSEISTIRQYISDVDKIDILEDGHLNLSEIRLLEDYLERSQLSWDEAWSSCLSDFNDNHYTTAIARRMTPIAQELYNTRRISNTEETTVLLDNEDEEDEDEYYDSIGRNGILPSNHLRACYECAVTIVNGQFYGFWKEALNNGLTRDLREKCPHGSLCEAQWRVEDHAAYLCHIEAAGPDENQSFSEFFNNYEF